MRRLARAGSVLAIPLLIAGCGGTAAPSQTAAPQPTDSPTLAPTVAPTPTSTPTAAPTATPTSAPTETIAASCVDVTDAGEPATVEASARSFSWLPGEITAKVGDVITWTNRDSVPHRVATDDGSCLMTSNIRGGGSRSLRFTTAGEYPFFCTVHPTMTGTIIITE